MKRSELKALISESLKEILAERELDFDDKDEMRINDLLIRAKGDPDKAIKLAQNMANAITDLSKAKRRADAANAKLDMFGKVTRIFNARAKELSKN